MSSTTYYLSEPSYITNTGKLHGTSLRCYEVTLAQDSRGRSKPIPTGIIYTMKSGRLVRGTTKAQLANKYLGWSAAPIHSSIDSRRDNWHSCLYTSPELAIGAKLYSIKSSYDNHIQALNEQLTRMKSISTYVDTYDTLASEHPELFV